MRRRTTCCTQRVCRETICAPAPPICVALRRRDRSESVEDAEDFDALAAAREVYLPCPKKALPPGLSRLRAIDVEHTAVTDLAPVACLPLEHLDLNHAERPDLAPLARIPTLRSVSLFGSAPDERGLATLAAGRPDVLIQR